ncbi:clusterin-associated protein 1 [Chrysoperla carnea]|uniref:clusterin-associated protein 1 n=1 Tax=Chrysoperla carnea TaxID=189513 RepID=UPI001D061C81|nr:clusterin-associated protein 1 [Chrysoperla carnea]
MSFRDLRNFTELLRTLGCQIQVSLESFRNPNFPLMSELLVWLSKRLDPDAEIPEGPYNTEQDRVLLIRTAAQFLAMKANLKLNTRRLYGADGHAVRELLKIATLLYDALNATDQNNKDEENSIEKLYDINDKVNELKVTRQLASEITSNGAILHELLGKEVDLQAQRHISVARQLEITTIEEGIESAMNALKKEAERIKKLTDNISATESSLDQKIERKRNELERNRNRLQTLQKVRPAFLDEYSALEKELQNLYNDYVSKYRTMVYLESLVAEQERAEAIRAETQQEAAQKLAEQMRLEEDIEELNELAEEDMIPVSPTTVTATLNAPEEERLRVKTGVRPRPGTRTTSRLYGAMHADSGNSDSSLTSTDSDSEDILLNDDDLDNLGYNPNTRKDVMDVMSVVDNELNIIDRDEDASAATQIPPRRRPSARIGSSHPKREMNDDDDDF